MRKVFRVFRSDFVSDNRQYIGMLNMNNKLICIKLFNSAERFCKRRPIMVVGMIPNIQGR